MGDIMKMLTVLGAVRRDNSSTFRALLNGIADGEVKVIKSEWADKFDRKHKEPPNLLPYNRETNRRSDWSTYDGCIDYKIKSNGDVEVTIFDGEMLNGERTYKRLTATLSVPIDILKETFGAVIEARFRSFLISEYEREKREEYDAIIKTRGEQLLAKL